MIPLILLFGAAASRPDPSGSASRVAVPAIEAMTARQREIYDQSSRFLGGPYGPRMALINVPEIEAPWSALLTTLEQTKLDRRLWELTILIVARQWDSQFEWWAHAPRAQMSGLPPATIEALRSGKSPHFDKPDEAAIYRYFSELYRHHDVSDAAYSHLTELIGADATVELTVLAAHYDGVAMLIASQHVALPPGTPSPLPRNANSGDRP